MIAQFLAWYLVIQVISLAAMPITALAFLGWIRYSGMSRGGLR